MGCEAYAVWRKLVRAIIRAIMSVALLHFIESFATVLHRKQKHELLSETVHNYFPATVGTVDGGRFALVDGALLMWFCKVGLGHGWHSLESHR